MNFLRITFSLLALVSPHLSHATGNCSDSVISKNFSKLNLSEMQIACIKADKDFVEALKFMCSQDRKRLSDQYKIYLQYETELDKAFEEFKNAKDQLARQQAQDKMYDIEREWTIRGFRTEGAISYNLVGHAEFNCRPE